MESNNKLKRGLSTRHIRFMALGSYRHRPVLQLGGRHQRMAGPGVLLAYCGGGRGVYHYARIGENVRSQPLPPAHFRAQENLGRLRASIRLDLLF